MTKHSPASASGRPGCPPANHLAAVVNGTLRDAELEQQIVAHLGECERCQATIDQFAGTEELADRLEALNETRDELPPQVRHLVEELAPVREFITENLSSAEEFPTLQIPEGPSAQKQLKRARVSRGAIVEVAVMAILAIGTIVVFWWPTEDEAATTGRSDWPASRSRTPAAPFSSESLTKLSTDHQPPSNPASNADTGPEPRFALLSPNGRPRLQSNLIGEVLATALRNDVIEIRHDGELTLSNQLIDVELEIRAATGCRPVLVPELNAEGTYQPLFRCRMPVRFRGLTMATPDGAVMPTPPRTQTLIHVERGSIDVDDCEFDLRRPGFEEVAIHVRSATAVELRNSQFRGGVALDLDLQTSCRLNISNSLLHGACPLIIHHYQDVDPSTVTLSKSTLIAETVCSLVTQQPLELQEEPPILWRAEDSIFVARDTLFSLSRMATVGTIETFDRVLGDSLWCVADCRSERCVFAIEQRYIASSRSIQMFRPSTRNEIEQRKRIPRIATLAHFRDVSGAKDTDSVDISFPVDAELLEPARLTQLEKLQADLLAAAAKSAQRDLGGRGFVLKR